MKYYKFKDIGKSDFYKIYKELFLNEEYKKNSAEAKWAYIILVDKLDNSKSDDEGNLYLVSIREEIQMLLNLSVNTVTKVFRELALADLISELKQGFGERKRTYVKKLENVDIVQIRNNSENVINIKKIKTVEVKNDNEVEIRNKVSISEKTEKISKIVPIEKFIFEDIEDAKREVSNTAFLKNTFSNYEKILDNIEIKSFLGNDRDMIEKAIDLIVKGAYQDKKVKNIKKLNKHMIEISLLKCKNRMRFKHTIVVKVLVDEILKTLEEKM